MIGLQKLQLSLCSVTLGCLDTNLSVLHPVLDLALPAGKCEAAVFVERVGVRLRDARS